MERAIITDRIFFLVVAGFVAGIFIRSFVDFGISFSLFLVLLGGVLFLYYPLSFSPSAPTTPPRRLGTPPQAGGDGERKTVYIVFIAVFLLAVGLGMLRYDFGERSAMRAGLDIHVGETISLTGVIVDEPDVRESTTWLILQVEAEQATSKILLTVAHEPRYFYGDKVQVEGRLERPANFSDDKTLREVDYRSLLSKDGIYYEMFKPKITKLSSDGGNWLIAKLFAFKNAFIANINKLIPEPHSALLGGLVVGAKQSLGKELLDDFRTVGVIHIVVLSGYNITIIAIFIEWMLSRLKRNARLVIAAIAMTLFAIMVGASATVIRATVMALLALLARGTGRIYEVTRALLVAGAIMLLHNPKILVFDTSFQLSFLATLGLIYVSPFIEPRVLFVTKRFHLREITVATIATQIFVLPFLLYKMGTLSLVALPVNLLILTAIPLTMLFGFLAGITAFISFALATPFAYIAYLFLAYELLVVEWFSKLPFATISISYFPLWLVIFWYAVYTAGFFLWRRRQSAVP